MKFRKIKNNLRIVIDEKYNGKQLSDFFTDFCFSKKAIHLLHQDKAYTINKEYVKEATLHVGDILVIRAYEDDDGMYPPVKGDLLVLYEDDLLLVVDKPAGLPVYPSSKEDTHSLSHYVSRYYKEHKLNVPVRYIHRLDDDTSGLVIYVKSALFQPYFDQQLAKKNIERQYMAFVKGTFPNKKIYTIDQKIARNRHSNKMRVSTSGVEAITQYKCITNYDDYALIQCHLLTGRRHQIRVHLANIGHPLIGDQLYNKELDDLDHLVPRQALHAFKVSFTHPLTNEQVEVESRIPNDLRVLFKK